MKKQDYSVSQREKDILNVLWNEGKPMIASDIAKSGDGLSINTVQSAIKSMLKKNLIEVADIVYSGTVLSRSYRTVVDQEEFIKEDMSRYFKDLDSHISTSGVVAALFNNEEDEEKVLDELEMLIKQKKKELAEKANSK